MLGMDAGDAATNPSQPLWSEPCAEPGLPAEPAVARNCFRNRIQETNPKKLYSALELFKWLQTLLKRLPSKLFALCLSPQLRSQDIKTLPSRYMSFMFPNLQALKHFESELGTPGNHILLRRVPSNIGSCFPCSWAEHWSQESTHDVQVPSVLEQAGHPGDRICMQRNAI